MLESIGITLIFISLGWGTCLVWDKIIADDDAFMVASLSSTLFWSWLWWGIVSGTLG